ncbi:3-deoxy-D-arabinoheptulosonate-7-phosphate synthase [Clostridium sp. USBA 49]|uniref:3-deoxy-7-phosphoheptulonate synthase n=1 Tax=Clostridium sp. USBA 49 TaxID=1881060 RepID=UPI00099AFC6C|nr:3-deoxy-7-phosphoheptulonate synthase [Clostridium sp. USBA 49]SKA86304.1 3-deoxy-D-arabinoheptulosonate-7-phosphate synthase [Clostridium sp. USBA 49]
MIIIMKPNTEKEAIEKLKLKVESLGVKVNMSEGENCCVLGLIGDTRKIDPNQFLTDENVDKVLRVQEPFKLANRKFHPQDSVIKVGENSIGGDKIAVMAGPCSVESEEQIISIAKQVKESGATFLRGGAFKPRTSPYSFQGLKEDGLELLKLAKQETGLPIVTEVMAVNQIEKVMESADILQIGARNMQNYDLLKEVGKTDKPILLKRGFSATIEEFIMSAEYIMAEGNQNVIFCERGIRTFETYTRNTLDLSAIPALKKLTHLPVIVDPSHATGLWWMVEPLAKAAIAVGADGLIIEVHNDPANAKCDGEQSIKPERFDALMKSLKEIAKINGRTL